MDEQIQGRKLYHIENAFFLITETQEIRIDEPIGWDKVLIQVKFDFSTMGYRYEFSDSDALLEFDIAAGGDVLYDIWKTRGTEGKAFLRFGEVQNGNFTLIYEGQINFESITEDKNLVKFQILRKSFNDKLRTRFDFKTDLNLQFALDGLELTPIQKRELYLHPRILSHVANYKYNPKVDVSQELTIEVEDDAAWHTTVPPFKFTSKNIDGIQEPLAPDGQLIYTGLTLPPGVTKRRFFFDAKLSFKFTIGTTLEFILGGFTIYKRSDITSGGNANFPPVTVPPDETYLISRQEYGNLGGTKTFTGSISGAIDAVEDEAIFIKAWVFTLNGTAVTDFEWLAVTSFELKIREQTVVTPSVITTPRIHEAVNRQLEIILNSTNPLKSSFLGRIDLGYAANGCASNHHILNGLMLRAFDGKPFDFSAKDWFNGLNSLFCMGMSVERDEDDNESIRLEELSYFFRDVLLMELPIVSKYGSDSAKEVTFNEVEFGFKKYPQDNQQDSIEDWMTRMSWTTPLTQVKNKFQKTIDFILSPYYIEYTRQQAFNENPSNAYETDNDIFLISAYEDAQNYPGVNIVFDAETNTITIQAIVALIAGDQFTITLAGALNGTFTVTSVEIPFLYTSTILTVEEVIADGTGTGTVTALTTRSKAKRNEDFQQTKNVSFPASVYNLEHHLKRIALRWAKFFQGGWHFFYGDNNKGLGFLNGANNIDVGTELKDSVDCAYGDPSKGLIYDRAFERSIPQFMNAPLFGKSIYQIQAPLSWQKFNDLRKAFEGRHPDGLDYGYFQWLHPRTGAIEKGFCLAMKFNPNTQLVTFDFIEKYQG